MPNAEKLAKKQIYFDKLINLIETSPQALIVEVDNVGSRQMQNIRMALRGKGVVLMGKNTMIRTALRMRIAQVEDPSGLQALLDNVLGNIGFIFLKEGQMEFARELLATETKEAAAKAGALGQTDITIPAGPTGLDPAAINLFQAMGIATKIVKGSIELLAEQKVVTAGEKVSMSAVALLNKMGIKAFKYGMKVRQVYQDGSVFDAAVLDITDAVLMTKFMRGVSNIAAFGRELGIPTEAGLPHMMANAFKNIASLVAEIDFTFKEVDIVKEFLADPSKFAAAAAASAPAAGGDAAAPAAAAAAAPVEEEEEDDMEFDLFD